MSENAITDAAVGSDLTATEMSQVVGGSSPVLYGIGYLVGMAAAMIVQTATATDMQPYCFGA